MASGGKREGAGRKKTQEPNRVGVSMRLKPNVLAKLKETALNYKTSIGRIVEMLIERL